LSEIFLKKFACNLPAKRGDFAGFSEKIKKCGFGVNA
jgi:hypothetical protein